MTARAPFVRYLRAYFITLLVGGGVVFGVNWVTDPYDVNGVFRASWLNDYKPDYDPHMLLAKAFAVRRARPAVLILGTSRSGDGYSPWHPALGGAATSVYNLGLDGINALHMAAYFRHAVEVSKVETAVIGLDYFMFNVASDRHRHDFDTSILAGYGTPATAALAYARSYFSFDTLLAAARTVASQHPGVAAPLARGMRGTLDYEQARLREGVRGSFTRVLRHFTQTAYLPGPGFDFTLDDGKDSSLEALRGMLRLARARGVRLQLVINPAHAWDQQLIQELGLWQGFEDWKRALVRLVEQEAPPGSATAAPALWDFSGCNTITTEPVTTDRSSTAPPRWFLDAEHFNQRTGDLVLDRVFGHVERGRDVPADFGVRLDSANVEQVLERLRLAQAGYAQAHAGDLAEIRAIAESQVIEAKSARRQAAATGRAP